LLEEEGMKIMDSKLRLFGIVSVVDIILILLFALFIVFALRFSAPQNVQAKAGDVPITYTIELQRKLPGFAELVVAGDDLYDSQKGYHIGKVVSALETPYLEDVGDQNAEIYRRKAVPGFQTIYVQVEAMAQITDMTTAVGAFDVLVGKEIYVKNSRFASNCYIVAVERGEGSD
jgi:hypothetical protein